MDISNINKEDLLKGREPVIFLDYDGTLTPIVRHPEDALISEEMKVMLKECASRYNVAVVSGRDMDDLKNMVGLEHLIYAGSHGFRISGPGGLYREHEKSASIISRLDKLEKYVESVFSAIDPGVQIDRKRYAIAVHYRNAREENIRAILGKVDEIVKDQPGFKTGEGKKIVEIKPDVDWHKGKAVLWIMEQLGTDDPGRYLPIYIGDDVTDEDAFEALKNRGIGILVGSHGKPTAAKFRLRDVSQVRSFLQKLTA